MSTHRRPVVACYADTSWWLAYKCRWDPHHGAAIRLFGHDERQLKVLWTPWQRVEVFNALRQLERVGTLKTGDSRRYIRQLLKEVDLGYWPHREFRWTNAVRRANLISERFGLNFPVRGMDLFHVAVALTLRAPIFLSFDAEQNHLAQAAGLSLP